MLNMVAPYHTKIIKMSKVNSLDLELAIDAPPPGGILHTMIPDTTLYKPQHEIC